MVEVTGKGVLEHLVVRQGQGAALVPTLVNLTQPDDVEGNLSTTIYSRRAYLEVVPMPVPRERTRCVGAFCRLPTAPANAIPARWPRHCKPCNILILLRGSYLGRGGPA